MLLRTALLLTAAIAVHAADPNVLTDAERREGWQLLFDGRTTAGWLEITGKPFPANCWKVEDGALRTLRRPDGLQDIRTGDSYRSFELQFDWKIGPDGNSGVKYLIQSVDEWTNKDGRQARARGPEYQLIDDANPEIANDPTPVRHAAALYSVLAPQPHIVPKIGEFNHSRLLVRGTHVEHWLNGTKVVQFETTDPAVRKLLRSHMTKGAAPDARIAESTPIGLQNHGSEVWFRNIKIRKL